MGFILRAHHHYNRGYDRIATRLREDFAGSAAVACAWVAMDENHRALAVDNHGPTLRWAQRYAHRTLGKRAEDLHLVMSDVVDIAPPLVPRVDAVAALNFSALIYHDADDLKHYMQSARRNLRPGGVFVMDFFTGFKTGSTRTRITPDDPALPPFVYIWEQRALRPRSRRIDCRIAFEVGRGRGRRILRGFRYDWRLWSAEELVEAALGAGFDHADIWGKRYNAGLGFRSTRFGPLPRAGLGRLDPTGDNAVFYLVANRR